MPACSSIPKHWLETSTFSASVRRALNLSKLSSGRDQSRSGYPNSKSSIQSNTYPVSGSDSLDSRSHLQDNAYLELGGMGKAGGHLNKTFSSIQSPDLNHCEYVESHEKGIVKAVDFEVLYGRNTVLKPTAGLSDKRAGIRR